MKHEHNNTSIAGIVIAILMLGVVVYFVSASNDPSQTAQPSTVTQEEPRFQVETIATELEQPWDVTFLPDNTPIFTEKVGRVSVIDDGKVRQLSGVPEVKDNGEGGLMGLAIDPDYKVSRLIYLCYNTGKDVRVVAWRLDKKVTKMKKVRPVVTEIPANVSGRHSGCRIKFGPEGYLWVGTGDAARASNPQDPQSLGGKILRVTTTGLGLYDNLGGKFDVRIFSYGHRNTQGIAFFDKPKNGIVGYSVEHGSDVNDEVNPLKKGNFGWDPEPPYVEQGVSMTDKDKFPNAIRATWRSGNDTEAPSGMEIISGSEWKTWKGALAVAMLKAQHLKVLTLKDDGSLDKEYRILNTYGRLRDVEQAPDGSLYVATDNGNDEDKIIKVTVDSDSTKD